VRSFHDVRDAPSPYGSDHDGQEGSWVAVIVVIAGALHPTAAQAASSVTNVVPAADGTVTATFTADLGCPVNIPCVNTLRVDQRYADGQCIPLLFTTRVPGLAVPAGSGLTTFTATFTQFGFPSGVRAPVRVCLEVEIPFVGGSERQSLADAVYTPNWQAPGPRASASAEHAGPVVACAGGRHAGANGHAAAPGDADAASRRRPAARGTRCKSAIRASRSPVGGV
jgi:hypothetical protein